MEIEKLLNELRISRELQETYKQLNFDLLLEITELKKEITALKKEKKIVCRYWKKGFCHLGNKCQFGHPNE